MRHTNMYKCGLLTAPAVLILAGCGGSDPASNGFPSNPSSQTSPTGPGVNGGSAMAALTFNRTYQYAVSGTVTKDVFNGTSAQTFSGQVTNATLTRVVTDGSPTLGFASFQVTDTLTYTLQGQAPAVEVSTWYLTQSGVDNSLNLAGVTRFTFLAVPNSPVPLAPGTFAAGTNLSSGSTFVSFPNAAPAGFTVPPPLSAPAGTPPQTYPVLPGDATISTTFTALKQESVPTTSGGPYTAWKSQYTRTELWNLDGAYPLALGDVIPQNFIVQSNITTTTTDDWVPSLSMPVRTLITVTRTDQPVTAYTFSPPVWNTPPSLTYTFGPLLHTKENLTAVLVSHT